MRDAILAPAADVRSHQMDSALPLRAAITRGALVTLANWPVVLIDFVVETLYKATLAVPVFGGAFMVAVLLGADVRSLLGGDVLAAADAILVALGSAPVALAAFLGALAIVAAAGAVVMFVIKAGTLSVLVRGERLAGDWERGPVRRAALHAAYAYSLPAVLAEMRRFGRRAGLLAAALGGVYAITTLGYLLAVSYGFQWVAASRFSQAWPLLVLLATTASVISLIVANLLFDLMRVVLIADDCTVRAAWHRVRTFLLADARQVLGIFGGMAMILMLATAASITATAGLALIAFVPLAGLAVLPLQITFWVVRGLFFQFANLTTLAAYQSQYRRYAAPRPTAVKLQAYEA